MKFRLIKLFIWICIIFGIVFYRQYVNIANFEIQKNQTITVEYGDTRRSILKTLWNFDAKMLSLYIKNNVWIAPNSTILNRVTLNRGSFVGLMSCVLKDVEEDTIVYGVPAKIHKK